MRQRRSARTLKARYTVTLGWLAVALLSACQPDDPNAPLQRYTGQLELALSIARSPALRRTPTPPAPQTTTLQRQLPTSTIANLDFLRLSGCAVQTNIGKRQTSLGRFAKPSQRLLLELEYLRLAPACIKHLRDRNRLALAATLDSAWRDTQAQLPALIFNATLAGDEYRAFWLADPAAGGFGQASPQAVSAAMRAINDQTRRWLNSDYRACGIEFELWLSTVAGGDGGAQLQAWSQQIDWLAGATALLEQGLLDGSVCTEHTLSGPAQNRIPIARDYFNKRVMPLTLRAKQRLEQAVSPVTALESQLHAALSPRYRAWLAQRNQLLQRLATTPARHIARLGLLEDSCIKR